MILTKAQRNAATAGYYTARQLRKAGVAEPILWRLDEMVLYAGKQPRYSKYFLEAIFGEQKFAEIEQTMFDMFKREQELKRQQKQEKSNNE